MPQYEGTEVLTNAKADAAKAVVEAWFGAKGYEDIPAMYGPGHRGAMWALSLEGYEDWAVDISQDQSVKWPAGVFAEPVASWCLGLYPAPDPAEKGEAAKLARDWEVATEKGWVVAQQRAGTAMARYIREH